jgi:hypothetical protein
VDWDGKDYVIRREMIQYSMAEFIQSPNLILTDDEDEITVF